MNYIGYVRCSKERQELTIDVQTNMIREYCKERNYHLKEIISDIDYSGKDLERPGIQQIMLDVTLDKVDIDDKSKRNNPISGIVFAKLDRLTRNVGDLSRLIEEDFKNVELHSVMENLESKTAGGRLFINMLVSVSSWERGVISERTKAVLQHKKRNGQHIGRIPFGKIIDKDGTLIDCPENGHIRIMVRELREKGFTYKKISERLFDKGLDRNGKPFSLTMIERICKAG